MGSTGDSLSEGPGNVGSMEVSSSEVSAIVKSDRVAMLMDGDWVAGVTGDAGIVSAPGAVNDSGEGG